MSQILRDICLITEHKNRKTVTVSDVRLNFIIFYLKFKLMYAIKVIFTLKRMGRPIYGFGTIEQE